MHEPDEPSEALPVRIGWPRTALAAVVLAWPGATLASESPAPPHVEPQARACTELRIDGVTPGAGRLQIAVYGTRETFRRQSLREASVVPGAPTFRLPLCGLATTEVAVVVTQDLDDDGAFDTNLVGMPKEPWGASGRRTLGPPSWTSARVALVPGGTIVVTLDRP
jgi:uncharacterized protein (DUF2141 family)